MLLRIGEGGKADVKLNSLLVAEQSEVRRSDVAGVEVTPPPSDGPESGRGPVVAVRPLCSTERGLEVSPLLGVEAALLATAGNS